MKLRLYLMVLAVAVLAGFGGAAAYRSLATERSSAGTERMLADGQRSAEHGRSQTPGLHAGSSTGDRVSAADFDGNVVLVNFWATWCQPCREEMPMLAELHRELGIDYPILVGSTDVMGVVRLYGNVSGVLPYSVLVDRGGVIRWTRLGVLEEAQKIILDYVALVAKAKDEFLMPEVRVILHDVPQNGPVADLDHRVRNVILQPA